VIILKVYRVIRMWLLLDYIIILSGVFKNRVCDACNLFEGGLHFLIKKMIIAEWNDVAVMNRQYWTVIHAGKVFNYTRR